MNYLALCRQAVQDCDVSGSGTTPTTVVSQTGQLKLIVDWVKNAYIEIQNKHTDWRWMRRQFTFNTVNNDGIYEYGDCTDVDASAVITRFDRWWADDYEFPFTIYAQAAGVAAERDLQYLPWSYFKRMYRRGTQVSGPPAHVSVDDANRLVLGPKPDGIYVVSGEFQRSAQILAADADIPEMPTQFHMLIVYRAMMKYAGFESAPEVYDTGNAQATMMIRQLEANQKPMPRMAPPLA